MKFPVRQKTQFSLVYLLIAVVVLSLVQSWLLAPRTVEIPMSKFLQLVREGKVEKVSLTDREIRGTLKPGALPAPQPGPGDKVRSLVGVDQPLTTFTTTRIPGIDDGSLVKELEQHKVEFSGRVESTFWRDFLFGWIVPLGLMVGIWLFLMRRMGGGPTQALSFGRSKAKIYDRKELKTTFADVAGVDEAKAVFIDELDAIGKTRAGTTGFVGGHDEREQTLNQLLAEMDGFDSSKGVIIMAATNRPEVLDPALLRAGRFDRQVVVDKPDVKGREAILRVHARNVILAPSADLRVLAARTAGMAGADLANLMNEAALLAARKGKDAVDMADLDEAVDRVVGGLERKSRVLSEKERDIVAHHEIGHALVATSLPQADPVHKVTIIPRGVGALGATYQLPLEDRYLLTRSELEDRIAVLLGGRAAEEVVYGEISTGAHNDLERATEMARLMVMQYGMSEHLGPMTFGGGQQAMFLRGAGLPQEREYSEATARVLDTETRAIIDRMYDRVRDLVRTKKKVLMDAAAELKQRETLEGDRLRQLLAGDPVEGHR